MWSGCNFQENSWEILGSYRYNYRLVNTCVCSETGFRLRPCNTPDSTLGEISNKNNRVGLPMTRTVKRHAPGSDNWYSLGICAKTMNIDKLSQNATNGNTFSSSPACFYTYRVYQKTVPTLFLQHPYVVRVLTTSQNSCFQVVCLLVCFSQIQGLWLVVVRTN